jgi:hypothetical protein
MQKAIWLTKDMNDGLAGFEAALRRIGADSHYIDKLPLGEERSKIVEEIFKTFKTIMGIGETGKIDHQKISFSAVTEELRRILGIAEAYEIRRKYFEKCR